MGYQITVAKFFTYFLLMSLMMLISETLGMLCAGLCRSELVGAIVLQGLYVPLLIFTGFFQARPPAARLPYPMHAPSRPCPGSPPLSLNKGGAGRPGPALAPLCARSRRRARQRTWSGSSSGPGSR